MSSSRKNWSALNSLTRQWTVEDEEEVEREKRRRVRNTSTADPDDLSLGHSPKDSLTNEDTPEQISNNDNVAAQSSAEQMQLDFVNMLRVRDEKRRKRHVEMLRQQKEGENEDGSQQVRVEILGDLDAEQEETEDQTRKEQSPAQTTRKEQSPAQTTRKEQSPAQTARKEQSPAQTTRKEQSPAQTTRKEESPAQTEPTSMNASGRAYTSMKENGSPLRSKDSRTKPPPIGHPKFVSSMSISFDNSCSHTERTNATTPTSPQTPTLFSAVQPSPVQSPTPNGQTSDSSNSRPAFVRQSSRTASYRMLKKREEEVMPLQRSASVRTTSKAFEANVDKEQEEDKTSPFQRNSRQRVSSRTIQEKMDRLAHAAQKSDMVRSPDVAQRTLFLLDEVSRKRGLFEKDPAATQESPGVLEQEKRTFASGLSDRINRWVHKTGKPGFTQNPADLRHVDIVSKRSLFERRGDVSPQPTTNSKVYK